MQFRLKKENTVTTLRPLCVALCLAIPLLTMSPAGDASKPVRIAPPMTPRLVLPVRADSPVQLQSVRITAEVNGMLALTSVEMTFFNPNRRILEGELQFPLSDGQSVESFAMDVDGKMREAVPVEKAKGQAVFEDVIRGRIDPGLLEVTEGNNFKLRVYPIPAQGTKRVVIRIAETLAGRDGSAPLRLPLEFGERIGSFALDVTVRGEAMPTVARGDPTLLKFTPSRKGFHARAERTDFADGGTLQIQVPTASGTYVITERRDGKTYFHASVSVESREGSRNLPKVVGLVWDSSGSGATRDHVREFALLDAYFKKMGNGEVRLTRVRDRIENAGSFRVNDGDWSALRKALAATVYDGATNLGAFAPDKRVGEYLLFSDGLANFGDQPFAQVAVPLYAVSAAVKSNPVFLRNVSQRSGGRFIDLSAEAPELATRRLLNAVTRVERVETEAVSHLVSGAPFADGGRVELAGVLTEPAGKLHIVLWHPDKFQSRTVTIPLETEGTGSDMAAGQWARLKVAQLEGEFDLNRAEIRRIGKQFRLVTRETSLIVLDRVEDYARNEILPPPELRAAYDQLIQAGVQRRDTERASHLAQVVRGFERKIAWWEKDFPKQAKLKEEAKIAAPQQSGALRQETPERDRAARRDSLAFEATTIARPTAPPASVAPPPPRPVESMPAPAAEPAKAAGASRPAAASVRALASDDAREQERGADRIAVAGARAKTSVNTGGMSIQLQKWQPDAPYVARMRAASASDAYRIYLDEKPAYLNSTAFFLDAADLLIEKNQHDLAVRVLTNLAEMDLENRHILRILGHRLLQAKVPALAIPVFKKVLALSPEEPQSYRDLGLALAAAGQHQAAVEALYEVVIRPWHNRFPGVELIALAELNAIAATSPRKLDTSRFDTRLVRNLPLDLRVVLTWDADNTDIDLWVTDPDQDKAYYGNPNTRQGGRMSADFTGGYGPEEFSLKSAKPGKYKIEAQYYGDARQNVTGPTTLQVKLATHFGQAKQEEKIVTLRLKSQRDLIYVGEFEVR
jgi:Ca-activated chloride channel homolog